MRLEESEEATVEVATSCIFVICICVFPLLIEKTHGGKGALEVGGVEERRQDWSGK